MWQRSRPSTGKGATGRTQSELGQICIAGKINYKFTEKITRRA